VTAVLEQPIRLAPVNHLARARTLRHVAVVLALVGWAVGAVTFISLSISNGGLVTGGDLQAYLRAGDDLLAGNAVYIGHIGETGVFSYAPPWAVVFGGLSWVPDLAMQVGIMALSLLSIRYVTGSWLWSGLVFFYPVSVMVMLAGNIEWLMAAAVVMAASGRPGPLVFTALAKISPMLGAAPGQWRQVAVVLAVAGLVTLPWLHLWPEWVEYLLRQPTSIDIHIGPPWYWRFPLALALLLIRRRWAAALAVVVAMPSLWLGSLVILASVVRLWLDDRRHQGARGADAP
jgi:hypothetical protein